MGRTRAALIWLALICAIAVPLALAAKSPLLAWRDPVYIFAGFAGVVAMGLLLVQPLLAAGNLPGVSGLRGRMAHRWVGVGLVSAVILHVAALWLTSPPDVVDALLFVSPTPFSAWGVIAMWAAFVAAGLAAFRRKIRLAPRMWKRAHTALAVLVVLGSVAHAMLIEGSMEMLSKAVLCILVLIATGSALVGLRIWGGRNSPRQ